MYVPGEPITEFIKLGWVIFFLGQETGDTNMLFPKPSLHYYEKLCRLDCLCIKEGRGVYKECQKQLERGPVGFYKTNLISKIRLLLSKRINLLTLVD